LGSARGQGHRARRQPISSPFIVEIIPWPSSDLAGRPGGRPCGALRRPYQQFCSLTASGSRSARAEFAPGPPFLKKTFFVADLHLPLREIDLELIVADVAAPAGCG